MYDIVRLMKPLPNVQLWFNNKVIPGGELKLIFWSNANDWKTDISNSLYLLKKIRYIFDKSMNFHLLNFLILKLKIDSLLFPGTHGLCGNFFSI